MWRRLKRYMCKCYGEDSKTRFYSINVETVEQVIHAMYKVNIPNIFLDHTHHQWIQNMSHSWSYASWLAHSLDLLNTSSAIEKQLIKTYVPKFRKNYLP